jgi:hypothetical protein
LFLELEEKSMSQSRRNEERLLSVDEQELVNQTHHPDLGHLNDEEFAGLTKRLREARDRARTISQRQRREMRGKAAPSGAVAATDNAGSVEKSSLLSAAMKRVNKEGARRHASKARTELVGNARRALAVKQMAGDPAAERPKSRTADTGMKSKPNEKIAPSGALEQEGFKPVLERSRKVR